MSSQPASLPAMPAQAAMRPHWLALALLIGAAVALGLLPYFTYIGLPWFALAYLAFGAGFAWWRLHDREIHATERPGPWEWLLAGGNALGIAATASLVGFLWYGIVYAVAWLAAWVVRAAGWAFVIEPAAVATWISVIIAGGMGLIVPSLAVNELRVKLYPEVAGERSAYYPLAGRRLRILACAAGIVAIGAAALLFPALEPRGLWFTLATALYFLFIASGLRGLPGGRPPAAGVPAALARCFEAAGYRSIPRPKSDDPALDPLIAAVDLLAVADARAYAVKLATLGGADVEPGRDRVLEVRMGARALQKGLAGGETGGAPVEPYLLVIGGRVPEDFWSFAGEAGVKLVHLPDTAALAPAGADPAEVALRVLQVPRAAAAPRARSASPSIAP